MNMLAATATWLQRPWQPGRLTRSLLKLTICIAIGSLVLPREGYVSARIQLTMPSWA
ncbi:hypothetical protein ATCCBAA256_14770 [Mycobacterium montefiorense]|nr:hypothetical protein ATCCBAA256_14770 [Mycobacterium montefiorense]